MKQQNIFFTLQQLIISEQNPRTNTEKIKRVCYICEDTSNVVMMAPVMI
jgi:hypothetical protein